MINSILHQLSRHKIHTHLLISFLIRIILIFISKISLLGVSYTDIDYTIFTDGAALVAQDGSPFDRDTYRYTPLLAWIMLPNIYVWHSFGKLLFASLDIISGWLIYLILLRLNSQKSQAIQVTSLCWLYNPLVAVVSTRGSAESVMTTLVLTCIYLVIQRRHTLAGVIFGISIHFKIYPIIYSLIIYLSLTKSSSSWKAFRPNKKKAMFFMSSVLGFIGPTYWSFIKYGQKYLDEAWIYHVTRKDTQHNFSPYFYIYHYTDDQETQQWLSLLAFIPQLVAIIWISFKFGIARKNKFQDLTFGLFVLTCAFVTLNKVITSQYFLWYISLLPFITLNINLDRTNWIIMTLVWLLSQAQWLLCAYFYEIQMMYHLLPLVWNASCIFMATNLGLLGFIIIRYSYKYDKFRNIKLKKK